MDLSSVIDAAGFTENDTDMATSGLCGTLSLALKQVFPEVSFAFICVNDLEGRPARSKRDGGLLWKHAVVTYEGSIFDVDGMVRLDDLVENYCWDNQHGTGGTMVPVDDSAFLEVLHADAKSFDQEYLERWSQMLAASLQRAARAFP